MKLFERRIIESLDNEYYFLTLETTGKYSIYNSREYNANFYRHVIDSIIGVIVLFLFPFLPLIPKLIRFSYVKGDSTNVNFITSPNQRFSSSEFRLGLVSGDKIIFPFHCYFSYLKLIIEFYKKYKLKLWYYQAVLKLPELFTVTNCIYNLKPHSVTMSNHCDRWALMLSFICEDLNIPLNLYQHGILETKDDLLKPKVKIGRVTNLYCYDDVSLELFKENICESIVNVFFLRK